MRKNVQRGFFFSVSGSVQGLRFHFFKDNFLLFFLLINFFPVFISDFHCSAHSQICTLGCMVSLLPCLQLPKKAGKLWMLEYCRSKLKAIAKASQEKIKSTKNEECKWRTNTKHFILPFAFNNSLTVEAREAKTVVLTWTSNPQVGFFF